MGTQDYYICDCSLEKLLLHETSLKTSNKFIIYRSKDYQKKQYVGVFLTQIYKYYNNIIKNYTRDIQKEMVSKTCADFV